MVLFLFLSDILYFKTRFNYEYAMQYIDTWLEYSILVGSAYKMIGVEPLFRFRYFQVVL